MASSSANVEVKLPVDMPKVQKTQFYRRPLPSSCIAFASEEGKKIFAEALATGHMNCFFKVRDFFLTATIVCFIVCVGRLSSLAVAVIMLKQIMNQHWNMFIQSQLVE